MASRLSLLITLNLILLLVSIVVGPGDLSLLNPDETQKYILFELRLPRTMALLTIGLSLSLSGLLLQTLLNNPLAEPYTLGLSGGATLGAVIFLFLGLKPEWLALPLGAALGCFLVTVLIVSSIQKNLFWKKHSLILTGVMISLFCGSLVTLIISFLEPSRIQLAVFWMMGQVGSTRDFWWVFLAPVFLITFFYFYKNKLHLDRFLLGEESAKNLGTPTAQMRNAIVLCVCLLTAISVSIAGLVGFVGLIAPHLSYLIFKTKRHHITLITCPLLGSALFMLSDILSRILSSDSEIPAGSLMAVIGAPLLVYFIFKRINYAEGA